MAESNEVFYILSHSKEQYCNLGFGFPTTNVCSGCVRGGRVCFFYKLTKSASLEERSARLLSFCDGRWVAWSVIGWIEPKPGETLLFSLPGTTFLVGTALHHHPQASREIDHFHSPRW